MENVQINFSKKNIKVNKQQHDIITEQPTKDICIISCAGSGKTLTITARVAYMINYYDCDPESFIITTFTIIYNFISIFNFIIHLIINIIIINKLYLNVLR